MVDDDGALDQVLEAVANPHRRDILRVLGLQPCAISQLARMRGLSLPAIHKHVKVLDEAGLITRRKQGRTTYLTLNRRPLAQLQEWVNQFHPYWGSDEATYENYLTLDSPSPLVGYCILNAEDMEEAESLVADMPIIDSVRIYEAHSM